MVEQGIGDPEGYTIEHDCANAIIHFLKLPHHLERLLNRFPTPAAPPGTMAGDAFSHFLIFSLGSRQVNQSSVPLLCPLQRVGALARTRATEHQHALFCRLCAWHTTSLRVKSDKLRVNNYRRGVKGRGPFTLSFPLFILHSPHAQARFRLLRLRGPKCRIAPLAIRAARVATGCWVKRRTVSAPGSKPTTKRRGMVMPIRRSISRTNSSSSADTKEMASPVASARAVRPIRWI